MTLSHAGEQHGPVFVAVALEKVPAQGCVVGTSDVETKRHCRRSQDRTCKTQPTALSWSGVQAVLRSETCSSCCPRHSTR